MTPAEELTTAAEKLRTLVKAIEAPDLSDQSWHVEQCVNEERGDCPCIVAQGRYPAEPSGAMQLLFYVADAETPECAAYIAAMGPPAALAMATVFDAWAHMIRYDADLLSRVGGDETLAVARLINGSQP